MVPSTYNFRLGVALRRVACFGLLLSSRALSAQGSSAPDSIAEARRLSEAKDYVGAAAIMSAYAESHPDDAGSARFAARMAYWAKDFSLARSIYERALERHADDAELRIEAAQFFAETGNAKRARSVIGPLVDSAPRELATTQRALTLLGTLHYWDGDFRKARALFIEAVRLDSTNLDARRQLREIELASAAWIAVPSVK